MKKDLGVVPAVYPMPVLMVATYDKNEKVNVMNVAWGQICDEDKIILFIGEGKKTWLNIKESKAFTVSIADEAHTDVADFFGIASGNRINDKFERTGYHAVKSDKVNAPIIKEFPVAMECELLEFTDTEYVSGIVGKIVNVKADEKVLGENGKVDPEKLHALMFDQFQNGYYSTGRKVAEAWNAGVDLMKNNKYKMRLKVNTAEHYDNLIDENNDPVRDPDILKKYMDKWDGQPFIDALELSEDKTVLEIGVGTGRLAVRTAPCCAKFCGIDISPKTVDRAKENLSFTNNAAIICADYSEYDFGTKFDIIYSSLTLLHIENKQAFFNKVFSDLKSNGRFVLSADDNGDDYLDMGKYKIRVYPDNPADTKAGLLSAGFVINEIIKTEFAHIFVCSKQ